MSTVTLPKGFVPISHVEINGMKYPTYIDPDWMRSFVQLLDRTGGVTSNTITEINIAAFEDAGIPEQQAEIHAVDVRYGQEPPPEVHVAPDDRYGQQPPEVHIVPDSLGIEGVAELQARVTVLENVIAGLMQGTAP